MSGVFVEGVDFPKRCKGCDFLNSDYTCQGGMFYYCMAKKSKSVAYGELPKEKPSWCPVKMGVPLE